MIAVISDSHIPHRAESIPDEFLEKVREADLTVHCGDFETVKVYDMLEKTAEKLIAVKGNCDRFELPNSEIFERKNILFGVYHGTGIVPRGDHDTLCKIADEDLEVDVLLHGHTHQQEAEAVEGSVLINPGSCTGVGGGSSRQGNPKMATIEPGESMINVVLIEKTDDGLDKQHIPFDIKEADE